jgi:RNA polymerase primary sigma factor
MGTPLQSALDVVRSNVRGQRPATKPTGPRTSSRVSADSIGWYLSTIGRVPLLTNSGGGLLALFHGSPG